MRLCSFSKTRTDERVSMIASTGGLWPIVALAAFIVAVSAFMKLRIFNRALEDTKPADRPAILRELRGVYRTAIFVDRALSANENKSACRIDLDGDDDTGPTRGVGDEEGN